MRPKKWLSILEKMQDQANRKLNRAGGIVELDIEAKLRLEGFGKDQIDKLNKKIRKSALAVGKVQLKKLDDLTEMIDRNERRISKKQVVKKDGDAKQDK